MYQRLVQQQTANWNSRVQGHSTTLPNEFLKDSHAEFLDPTRGSVIRPANQRIYYPRLLIRTSSLVWIGSFRSPLRRPWRPSRFHVWKLSLRLQESNFRWWWCEIWLTYLETSQRIRIYAGGGVLGDLCSLIDRISFRQRGASECRRRL